MKVIARQESMGAASKWFIYVPKLDATTATGHREDVERQALVMIRELTGKSPRALRVEYVEEL